MVWYVLVIEAIVFAVLFTTILFVSFHGKKCTVRHVSIITHLIFKKNTSKHMKEWMFHISQKR